MMKRGRPMHPDILTPAEWRVVEGVRHGLTNPAIARLCNLSVDAVKFHVSNALGKLGLSSRQQLRQWPGIRADSALGKRGMPGHGAGWSLGQISRVASDVERMADWFADAMGLAEIMRFENAVFFDLGGVRLYLSAGDPATNSLLYFRVPDIHSEVESLRSSGVAIRSAPHRIHVHDDGTEEWMAFFADPEGGTLGLMSAIHPAEGGSE